MPVCPEAMMPEIIYRTVEPHGCKPETRRATSPNPFHRTILCDKPGQLDMVVEEHPSQ